MARSVDADAIHTTSGEVDIFQRYATRRRLTVSEIKICSAVKPSNRMPMGAQRIIKEHRFVRTPAVSILALKFLADSP